MWKILTASILNYFPHSFSSKPQLFCMETFSS